jgi:hypothetical protein
VVSSDGPGVYSVVRDITAGVDLASTADAKAQSSASKPAAPFRLSAGSVAYITTGAPVPDGADAVVQVEKTQAVPNQPDKVPASLPFPSLPLPSPPPHYSALMSGEDNGYTLSKSVHSADRL